jgi:hypothetical protein
MCHIVKYEYHKDVVRPILLTNHKTLFMLELLPHSMFCTQPSMCFALKSQIPKYKEGGGNKVSQFMKSALDTGTLVGR